MEFFVMLDFFTTIINAVFRNIPDYLRYILIFVFATLTAFFIAKSLNKKKSSSDKKPIKYGYLFLAVISLVLCFLYIFFK